MRLMRESKMKNSERMVDILQSKLNEFSNQRGNIIYNSLGNHKRAASKHRSTSVSVADPRVYSILGKLH